MPNVQNEVDMWECVLSKSRSLFVRLAADFTVRCLELGNENLGNFEISGNLFLSNAQTANCTVLIPSEAWNHGNAAVIKRNNKFNKFRNRSLYLFKTSLVKALWTGVTFSFYWKHLLTVFWSPKLPEDVISLRCRFNSWNHENANVFDLNNIFKNTIRDRDSIAL